MKLRESNSKKIYNLHKGKTVLDSKGRECVICGYLTEPYKIYETYIIVAYFAGIIGWKPTPTFSGKDYYIDAKYTKDAKGFLFANFNEITIL